MAVDPGKLPVLFVFGDPIVVVQTRLSPPADMKRGCDVRLGPFHDHGQFLPVSHLLKLHHLHRSSGDDHAVVFPLADLRKRHVKLIQMAGRRILGLVGTQHQKRAVNLQRRVGQRPQKLGLRLLLNGHQV